MSIRSINKLEKVHVKIALRPYVRRKSDLPLYIDQIHVFILTQPVTP